MFIRNISGIIIVGLLLFTQALDCFAVENMTQGDWRTNLKDIKAAIEKVQSIKASFIQEKKMKILIKPLASKGVFFFQKPGSLRWEYKSPVQSVLIFHGAQTRYFVRGSSGLTETTGSGAQAMQVGLQEISRWLGGRFDENPAFDIRLKPGEKIILTAKDASIGRFVQKIEIHLAKQPGGVESAWIYESEDSYTRLIFENSVFNEHLNTSLFTEVK